MTSLPVLPDDWDPEDQLIENIRLRTGQFSFLHAIERAIRYEEDVSRFVTELVTSYPSETESIELRTLQPRILKYLVCDVLFGDPVSPAQLADGIEERNRRLVRAAMRTLVQKELIAVQTEPAVGDEGERILSCGPSERFVAAYKFFREAGRTTLDQETAAATKQ